MKHKDKIMVLKKRDFVAFKKIVESNENTIYVESPSAVSEFQNITDDIVIFDRSRFN